MSRQTRKCLQGSASNQSQQPGLQLLSPSSSSWLPSCGSFTEPDSASRSQAQSSPKRSWRPRRSVAAAAVGALSGIHGASASLQLWSRDTNIDGETGAWNLEESIPLTTLTHYLGAQNFTLDVPMTKVVVHETKRTWDCLRDEAELKSKWRDKVVLFHRKSVCSSGVETIYEALAESESQLVVKISPYNPPGMWYNMYGRWQKIVNKGMIFTQVFSSDIQPILAKMSDAQRLGRSEDYRLRFSPDENKWAEMYASSYWIIPVRVIFPTIALLTSVRAAISLHHLYAMGCTLHDIDVVHLTLALELVRNSIMAFFLAEGMNGGSWVPWNVMSCFIMGLPGMGLVSWILVALKWREVRHATRRNRPMRNVLHVYPRIIMMAMFVLMGIDLRMAWDRLFWRSTHSVMQLGYDTYGLIGGIVSMCLLVQGGQVLYSLRNGSFILAEVDAELLRSFWIMTAWMMFGAICSCIFIGVVCFQVMVGLKWFWQLHHYITYFQFVYCSLMLTSFAYVMSLTPLATTGGAVMERFGKWLTMFDAATCAALLGDHANASKLLQEGVGSVRGIRLSELTKEDLFSNRSEKTPEGQICAEGVDWFISHSWHDDAESKWEILHILADHFKAQHGREPVLWIDKFCIDQKNIAASLSYLPIYLLLCQRMVVLSGSTYTSRLWCNWELFMVYGICHKPMIEVDFVPIGGYSLEDLANNLEVFDMANADCFLESDKTSMLEVIDKSGKGREGFNATIRNLAKMVHDNVRKLPRKSSRRLRRTTFFQTASRIKMVELSTRASNASRASTASCASGVSFSRASNAGLLEGGDPPSGLAKIRRALRRIVMIRRAFRVEEQP